jgi:hypothetical protein
MGFMAALTVFALLVIAGFVKEISKMPTVAGPVALTARTHTTRHVTASRSPRSRSPRPKPSPSASPQATEVADASSGLSYQLLASPWQQGCPSILNTSVFSWTAGENALAGQADIDGTVIDWHGVACSGQLGQQFAYSGPADLEPVTISVAGELESSYYAGLQDYPTLESSSAMQVSGHPAWVVTFLMTYPDAASEGLLWTTEAAAAVVVDRGPGQAPAVFYTSVPDNLDTLNVGTLVSSLQLNVSPG